MSDTESPSGPPPCPRDGVRMLASKRSMRTYDMVRGGPAVPIDKTVEVWRCPACGRELPRQAQAQA